jgi:ABC-type transport system involved in multi-copper enzyme maturation permease subunit
VFAVVPTLVDPHVWTLRSHLAQLAATNPYVLLKFLPSAWAPRAPAVGAVEVVTCCFVLLSGAWFILTCTERLVARVALRRAMGEPALLDRLRRGRFRNAGADPERRKQRSGIRRVTGPPLIWKELTCTLSRRETFVSHTILGAEITLILIAYLFPVMMSVIPYEFLHLLYVFGFLGAAVLLTITASASVISTERESRTWPLLLLTPLTDREILLGKFVGVLRRCGPVWLVLLAYVAGFAYARCFHPLAAVQVTMIILSTLPFLTAAGFYFGSRFHRTTEAVTANLVLAGILWCIPPILGAVAQAGLKGAWNGGESVAYTFIPFAQAFALVATTLDGYYGNIEWFGHFLNAPELAVLMLVSMVGYAVVALLFAWRAVQGFRRRML